MFSPNKKSAKKFLSLLDPDTDIFTFQCFHYNKRKHPSGILHDSLDDLWDKLCWYNKEGYGVYVCVNKTDLMGRMIQNIKEIRAVWQEDDGEGRTLPIKPHIVVETSPGRFHRYMLVSGADTEVVKKHQFDVINDVLVGKYGSDKNAKDLARVLRVPGFYNCKPSLSEPFLCHIAKSRRKLKRYSWKQIEKAFSYKRANKGLGIVGLDGGGRGAGRGGGREFGESFDYNKAINEIAGAKEYYQPMLKWAMSMANLEVPHDGISTILKMALEMGKRARPEQDMLVWQQRYDACESMALSAVSKVKRERNLSASVGQADWAGSLLNGKELFESDIETVKYIVDPIITRPSINMIHASRGLGKTFFAMSLGVAIAVGYPFLMWQSVNKSKVLYVDGELPLARLQDQFITSCLSVGVDPDLLDDSMTLMSGDQLPNNIFPDLTFKANQRSFDAMVDSEKFDLIIFDNISTIFKSAEIRQESWKPVQDWCISLRTRGMSVILIHHDNKAADAQRGFSNKEDVMDTVIHLQIPRNRKETDGAKFNLTYSKHRYFSGLQAKHLGVELVTTDNDSNWVYGQLHGSNYDLAVGYFKDGYIFNEIRSLTGINSVELLKIKKKALEKGDLLESDVLKGKPGRRAEGEGSDAYAVGSDGEEICVNAELSKSLSGEGAVNMSPLEKKRAACVKNMEGIKVREDKVLELARVGKSTGTIKRGKRGDRFDSVDDLEGYRKRGGCDKFRDVVSVDDRFWGEEEKNEFSRLLEIARTEGRIKSIRGCVGGRISNSCRKKIAWNKKVKLSLMAEVEMERIRRCGAKMDPVRRAKWGKK